MYHGTDRRYLTRKVGQLLIVWLVVKTELICRNSGQKKCNQVIKGSHHKLPTWLQEFGDLYTTAHSLVMDDGGEREGRLYVCNRAFKGNGTRRLHATVHYNGSNLHATALSSDLGCLYNCAPVGEKGRVSACNRSLKVSKGSVMY